MDDERSCDGSAFQTAGVATWKLRRPSCVLVEGTSIVVAFCRTKICPTRNADADVKQDSAHRHSQYLDTDKVAIHL